MGLPMDSTCEGPPLYFLWSALRPLLENPSPTVHDPIKILIIEITKRTQEANKMLHDTFLSA